MKKYLCALFFVLAISCMPSAICGVFAEVPNEITYTGRLREYGQAASGTKTIRFTIYDASSGGNQKWTSGDVSVTVTNGVFTQTLSPNVDWRGGSFWIETIISGKVLSPREKLTTQVFALHSRTAEDVEKASGQNIHFSVGNSTYVVILATGTVQINGSLEVSNYMNSFWDRGDPSSADFTAASFTTDNTWRTMDLSSIVPTGTKAVLLYITARNDSGLRIMKFRKKGNSNEYNVSEMQALAGEYRSGDYIVPVSTAREIEYKIPSATNWLINVAVKGWWK
ncbi:MAG: hypothetical protein JW803_08165 [Endomicrobiales bacterium]|nr:hypothetical protein [Endomicrobiales bacterium]